jgi:hypothetical protein
MDSLHRFDLGQGTKAAQADHQHPAADAQVHARDGLLFQLGLAYGARAQLPDSKLFARPKHGTFRNASLAAQVAMVPAKLGFSSDEPSDFLRLWRSRAFISSASVGPLETPLRSGR